jgi:hypothetical protein
MVLIKVAGTESLIFILAQKDLKFHRIQDFFNLGDRHTAKVIMLIPTGWVNSIDLLEVLTQHASFDAPLI